MSAGRSYSRKKELDPMEGQRCSQCLTEIMWEKPDFCLVTWARSGHKALNTGPVPGERL